MFFGLEVLEIIFCIFVIGVGGFLRGFLGFGAALVIVPSLSIVLPPVFAIGILVIIEIPTIMYLVPANIRDANLRTLVPMLCGLVIAVPIGTLILVETEPTLMKLIISVVMLLTVGLLASGWRFKGDVGKGLMTLSGTVGGLIQGSAGMGGPPLVTALMSLPDNPTTTRANIVMALSSMSSLNLASLLFLGKITQELLYFGALCAPVYLLINYIGARYFKQHGSTHFRTAALIVLTFIALVTIYSNLA